MIESRGKGDCRRSGPQSSWSVLDADGLVAVGGLESQSDGVADRSSNNLVEEDRQQTRKVSNDSDFPRSAGLPTAIITALPIGLPALSDALFRFFVQLPRT